MKIDQSTVITGVIVLALAVGAYFFFTQKCRFVPGQLMPWCGESEPPAGGLPKGSPEDAMYAGYY